MAFLKKEYGKSYEQKCAFCEKTGTCYNSQKIPVCVKHKNEILKVERCSICSGFAELKKGKYGVFVLCDNCGPVSLKKHLLI